MPEMEGKDLCEEILGPVLLAQIEQEFPKANYDVLAKLLKEDGSHIVALAKALMGK